MSQEPEAIVPQKPEPPVCTIANGLTIARLVLLPIVVFGVARDHGWIAVIAMALVVLTDLADGRIARRMGQTSEFGKSLDSTVDFVFIYSTFIAFYAAGHINSLQFAFLYLAMFSILAMELMAQCKGEAGVVRTNLMKPVGALQFFYLLWITFLLVIPVGTGLKVVNDIFFSILAILIVLNTAECLNYCSAAAAPKASEAEATNDEDPTL
jgi:phosphatidylglycerophosphate synthase